MKTTKKLIPVAVAAAMSAFSASVHTAGFQLPENNASGMGNAFAGQAAAAENASTVFWNPAGMTRLPGRQVSFALDALKPSAKFEDNGLSRSPLGLPLGPGGTNGGDAGDWAYLPAGYVSWQINPQWWAGLAVTVPFGLQVNHDPAFIGRFQSKRDQVKTIDINPNIAFKLSDAVSLGGGISYQKLKVQLDRSTLLPGGVEGMSQTRVDDDKWGFNLGAMFTIGAGTRIGITYRSNMDYDTTGTVLVGGLPPPNGTTVAGAAAPIKLPDTVSWAIAHPLNGQWELLGDITWTNWSTIKTVPLSTTTASLLGAPGTVLDPFNFQFRDSYRVGVGANWKYRDDLMLKFGVSWDRSPVTDLFRTTFLPDNNRIGLGIGAKFQVSKQTTIDVGYMHLFVESADINQQKGVGVAPFQGNVRGKYDDKLDALAAQFTYSF